MNDFILAPLRREKEYTELLDSCRRQSAALNPAPVRLTGLSEGARNVFIRAFTLDAALFLGKGTLLIVPDEKAAAKASAALTELGANVLNYPYRDFTFYNMTASREAEQERLGILCAVMSGEADIVIATPDAALQYTMPREVLEKSVRTINSSDVIDMSELQLFLTGSGYVRTELVDGVGQFSVRGGIIDIYAPGTDYPYRIELYGDEIDQMACFDIITQRRVETVDKVRLIPCRELLLDGNTRAEVLKTASTNQKRSKKEETKKQLASECEALENGLELNSLDKYISVIYPQKECLLDYFKTGHPVLCQELGAAAERVKSFEWRTKENITSLLSDGLINPSCADYNKWGADLSAFISKHPGVICDTFASSLSDIRLAGLYSIISRQTVSYADNLTLLKEDLSAYRKNGFDTVISCENETMAKNIQSVLAADGVAAVLHFTESEVPPDGVPQIIFGCRIPGYELTMAKFAFMSVCQQTTTSAGIISQRKKRRIGKRSAQEKILSYADLEPGDYVVHVNHGIGMYIGMDTITVGGITRDYIKIKYAGKDMLYIPANQLESVSKYIGARAEDGTVKLSKMGGAEWGKSKAQAKKAAKEMAKELIQLYAERQRKPGFACRKDDDMQREFEAAFEYEETEGQLTAVGEIKKDMESSVPMDRLLCGDVGFGKTEVALRAAFKAVENGKQVAVLVPTTILALQHYQTILSRMRGFPVKADMISRFRSPKQQQESLRRLRRGETDILVGTHRLVSSDIEFRDLGLVIIDEEQRFGVAHKEKLKQLSVGADVLTLTATPIPRTLNMAMSGIRDMSVLEEAPGDRYPVQTYVLEYDDMIIGDAIRQELRRGGQVFYLHNRVESLQATAAKIAAMAPEARIACAHGQMDREQLSDIWRSMINGETDVLISTTIIESGVDIPNANTLIIENADRLGLGQLHQIRGRVGRSNRRAYAYFTYPKGAVLSEIATKRLSAIRDYTEFGSGFKVALRDLEIRGAGNLLGAEQHGHMENIGYDLYMRILNEAILEEKGEAVKKKVECTVELDINAYIPESYVRSSNQRIDIYKKISLIENSEDMSDVTDELLDRYGDMPAAVNNLLKVSLIRALGSACGVSKIAYRNGSILVYQDNFDSAVWTSLAAAERGTLLISFGMLPYVSRKIKKGENAPDTAIALLKKYKEVKDNGKE